MIEALSMFITDEQRMMSRYASTMDHAALLPNTTEAGFVSVFNNDKASDAIAKQHDPVDLMLPLPALSTTPLLPTTGIDLRDNYMGPFLDQHLLANRFCSGLVLQGLVIPVGVCWLTWMGVIAY